MSEKLPKNQKLKRKKIIEELFKSGNTIKSFPLILVYIETDLPDSTSIQVGFSVPKRNHKLAVTRNRLKRLLRESYRKKKEEFKVENCSYAFMFIYVGKDRDSLEHINHVMNKIIAKFNVAILKNGEVSTKTT
ncbi:MAG: ribonuclease P protein component [Leeuwenhoekiella sp.]